MAISVCSDSRDVLSNTECWRLNKMKWFGGQATEVSSLRTSYEGYQVWRLNVSNENLTSDFNTKISDRDVWRRTDNNIDFLLNGNETEYWNKFLESQNIGYAVLLDDVQKAIEKEDIMKKYGSFRRAGKINWSSYPSSLSDIYEYMRSVVTANPSSCSLQTIGKTAHGKEIKMLKLSAGPSNRAFLLEAGMHGREWISITSILYFIEHIAWNYTSQPEYIKNKDWYIIPVSNPDGYEYTLTTNRLWRKNRRRFSGDCDGVDLNRNFDSSWGQRGASNVICSILYCGPEAFSEAESIAIKNVMSSRHFTGYVGIHSYGSTVTYPWGASGDPTDRAGLHTLVVKEMVMAMRAVGEEHFRGGTTKLLRSTKASGMAMDWAFSQGVHHSYLIETRGGHGGQFLLEPNQILPSGQEVAAGLVAMARVIA